MATLTLNEIRNRAYQFVKDWEGETSERAEAQTFWNEFFKVFGLERRRLASFEKSVDRLGKNRGRIDLFWPGELIAEHKSAGEDMGKATTQAFEYLHGLKSHELPGYIIVSDFGRFKLFNLQEETLEEHSFTLAELPDRIDLLSFIAGYTPKTYKDEDPINMQAAAKLGELHDALKENKYDEHFLKVFLVRLLFILFAEDTGIFDKDWFRWCLENKTGEDGSNTGAFLNDLFAVLDTPEKERQKNLDEDLNKFCYVNGSLFSENLRSPHFDADARNLLLDCCGIDWTKVSPAIFGSMFQSVMDGKERRQLGAHYTSEKNILKLIKSLFLDDLTTELASIQQDRSTHKKRRLEEYHQKLRSLKFMDPACGCGNFLVIAYRELRLLEMDVIMALRKMELTQAGVYQLKADSALYSTVNVDQFYGIEIEEFPVQIARVAMWLTDHQMNMRLAQQTGLYHLRLPLVTEPNVIQGNALRMIWDDLVPREAIHYVFGNPPFIGKNYMTDVQEGDVETVLEQIPKKGLLDYVTCWYVKTIQYIYGTDIRCAFVSTNSITQGQQVGILWPYLISCGFKFHFAHRTFKWTNEARGKAAVYVIIIGFGIKDIKQKVLYEYEALDAEPFAREVDKINPYLIDADTVLLQERAKPVCDVPPMVNGSKPTDGGHLILSEAEKNEFIKIWPDAKPFIKPLLGSEEFLNGYCRYCIWLNHVPPAAYRHIKGITERIEQVRMMRVASKDKATRKDADIPALFQAIRQSTSEFVLIPSVSSENRYYVPIGFYTPETIITNLAYQVPNATLFHFGVLSSLMHMAWMRQVCGRLKSDYRYSNKLVYNNYPWPLNPTDKQKQAVEEAAQKILDIRQPLLDRGNTLADLYDPTTMPVELLKAHQALDKAVDACYGRKTFASELERVSFLFELYKQYTAK